MPAPADLSIVLVRTQGPVNLGLIARLCGNLGIDDLRLVDPQCDRDCDEARRFANKATHRLERAPVFADLATAVADMDQVLGTTARTRQPEQGVGIGPAAIPDWLTERGGGRLGLVFGNEAHGLSAAELAACQGFLHLPMPGDYASYNLSHAVALTAFLATGCDTADVTAPADEPPASAGERDGLFKYWTGTAERFGHFTDVDEGKRQGWVTRFRTWFDQAPMTRAQATVLRGLLARFNAHSFGDKAAAMARTGRAPDQQDQENS